MNRQIVIGSRGSKLALWQAEWVRARLAELSGGADARIEVIKSTGDRLQDVPLAAIGGQGVFTKELEQALVEGRIDVAVHSLKDLPTTIPGELAITAVTEREDARDALILPAGAEVAGASIKSLPAGARVGTSSPRRQAQLRGLRPDVALLDLRGNVDTRLRKLDAGDYDAIILASAGLRRLGFERRISAPVPTEEMLPAVGQGALGVETRAGDAPTNALVARLEHAATRAACTAERALLRRLGGGCQLPIAAHAVVAGARLRLEGFAGAPSGEVVIRESIEGAATDAAALGEALAARMQELGAGSLFSRAPV